VARIHKKNITTGIGQHHHKSSVFLIIKFTSFLPSSPKSIFSPNSFMKSVNGPVRTFLILSYNQPLLLAASSSGLNECSVPSKSCTEYLRGPDSKRPVVEDSAEEGPEEEDFVEEGTGEEDSVEEGPEEEDFSDEEAGMKKFGG
jgi:hypothetical protein